MSRKKRFIILINKIKNSLKRFTDEQIISKFYYSFPFQLFIYNVKKNQVLLLLWLIILAIVTQSLGRFIGVPSLFLDPEYINRVDFWSFFMMGFTLGIFTMSYHIISYILDAPQFSFTGNLRRPFTKFLINNSLIPVLVIAIYVINLIDFQASYAYNTVWDVSERTAGLIIGMILSASLIFLYFISTNKDIFKLLASRVDERLRRTKVVRINVLGRIQDSRNSHIRVDYYLVHPFRLKKIDKAMVFDRQTVLKVFDQNHLNAVIIQLTILGFVLLVGTLRDYPFFQIPAGASLLLLFTILLMFAGALSYWLRGWTLTFTIALILLLNYLMKEQVLIANYEAYGMNYQTEKAEYSLRRVKELSRDSIYKVDRELTLIALENWKNKFQQENPLTKPKMVFVCVSGGGQRAAVWTMRTLQYADSTLEGKLMKHTMLITGASGGLVGAAYFRELCLRKELYQRGESPQSVNPYASKYLDNIAKDNLNAIMFSLVVNDLFFGFQKFNYAGKYYDKDRGYAFEEQLNRNTESILDKALCEYREPELLSIVPMMILAPTVVNDGRKLFISPLHVSYMTVPRIDEVRFLNQKTKGIEFLRFFEAQNSSDLRFLSALRMSATFPYVTPNVKLPSDPEMEIMDAGLSDNFGVSDAVRFLYAFRDWIGKNTSGVIFVSIRDTQKDKPIEESIEQSLFQRIFTPVSSLYGNLEYLQDIANDNMVEFARSWFNTSFPIHRVEFQYVPISNNLSEIQARKQEQNQEAGKPVDPYKIIKIERAALSWRLTEKEKESLKRTIFELRNQFSIQQLERLLQ
ncbi:MAG: patatin-like phospholipase family protein [Microscillaceae bacterium]|nr:patatin-like phospholipase family protein [Microscillaceae bacterium]